MTPVEAGRTGGAEASWTETVAERDPTLRGRGERAGSRGAAPRPILLAVLFVLACGGSAAEPSAERAPRPSPAAQPAVPPTTPLAVTVDDLPWVGPVPPNDDAARAVGRILAAASEHGAPLTGFVTCRNADARPDAHARWIDAGVPLGNHTHTHRAIDDLGLEAWRRDVVRCQERLERDARRPVVFFRYPYLRTGRTRSLRDGSFAALAELGLRRAPVSVDTSDWALARPYVAARATGDAERATAIADAYVDHVLRAARRSRRIAEELDHAGTPLVLLLHANALAADHLGALLDALENEAFRFVTLEDALADPLYAREDRYVGSIGLSWLYRVADRDAEARWAWDEAELRALEQGFGGHE